MSQKIDRAQVYQVFAIVALPIHIWLYLFNYANLSAVSWASDWADQIAIWGYILMVGLIESIIFSVPLVGLAWGMTRFLGAPASVARLSLAVWWLSVWLAIFRSQSIPDFANFANTMHALDGLAPAGWRVYWAAWLAVWIVPLGVGLTVLVRRPKWQAWLADNLMPRLTLLMSLYLVLDGVLLAFLIVRNI